MYKQISYLDRSHPGSQYSYCPGRSALESPTTDNGHQAAARKRLLYPHSLSLDAVHLLPYVDSASWLYLDPNPVFPVRLPSWGRHDAPLFGQEGHRHHHHHHHHQRHRQHYYQRHRRQGRHRRVLSDPGAGGWRSAGARRDTGTARITHRRVLSSAGADLMRASIDEANEDNLSPEETGASTFRKVPWHPNLHMLKIRRT